MLSFSSRPQTDEPNPHVETTIFSYKLSTSSALRAQIDTERKKAQESWLENYSNDGYLVRYGLKPHTDDEVAI